MIIDDGLIFSSGRKEYGNMGIVGVNEKLEVSYGCDGGYWDRDWTREEKIELADHMIKLWTLYKDRG